MADEWIEWNGGEMPVADDVKVDAKFRRGNVVSSMEAGFWRWGHSHPSDRKERQSDIISYRVVSP